MAILVTGASGFLGTVLVDRLLEKGHRVYGVSRHPPAPRKNLIPLRGDIIQPGLGLTIEVPRDIHAVHHLAGIHNLGEDKDRSIWRTNVLGTRSVIDFCARHKIPRLYFTSTAYTLGRNTYERSKALCELEIKESDIPHVTIFKPSVVMGTEEHPYPGHFSQFVSAVVKIHQRAELIRRKIEGTLRLPVIEPVFRIRGNPQSTLNLVPVDMVAQAIANIKDAGTFWLTNPTPPTLSQLVEWVGEFILVRMKVEPEFKPTPIEAQFAKMAKSFVPYLQGDDFSSDLESCPITREFIHDTIKRTLQS